MPEEPSTAERLGLPRDTRGIVLACASVGAVLLGIAVLISAADPIGWAYIAVGVVAYVYLQTRALPALAWLLVASYGAWSAMSGAPVNWLECAVALVLAALALRPPAGVGPPNTARWDSAPSSPHLESVSVNGSEPIAADPTDGGLAANRQVRLRTLGSFQFQTAAGDLAPQLEDKPVLSFLFKYLLARHVIGDPKIARSAVGDELTPGVSEASQRDRLRKQLYDLQRDAGPELGSLIGSNRSHVWLNLSGLESDFGRLHQLATEVRGNGDLVASRLASEVRAFLDETQGQEFLAGFEELENKVNQGRGTAGQTVADARLVIEAERADLVRALADYEDAMGRPESAIRYLRSELEAQPSRQDLARQLVTAYLKTGQLARATEVREQFALSKE